VSKTAYIAEGACIFEVSDTYDEDRICCEYGADELKITVSGEPAAITNSEEF
jgi:hypothetical protein